MGETASNPIAVVCSWTSEQLPVQSYSTHATGGFTVLLRLVPMAYGIRVG